MTQLYISDEDEDRFILGISLLNYNVCLLLSAMGVPFSLERSYLTLDNLVLLTSHSTLDLQSASRDYISLPKMIRIHRLVYETYSLKDKYIDLDNAIKSVLDIDSDDEQSDDWNLVTTEIEHASE